MTLICLIIFLKSILNYVLSYLFLISAMIRLIIHFLFKSPFLILFHGSFEQETNQYSKLTFESS